MAIGRGALVDRAVQRQMRADAARGQVHDLPDRGLDPGLVHHARAMRIRIDRQRLGHADGIAQLQRAALGQPRGDHVLGEVARRIGRRAVHLGRVLAREGTAAMRRGPAVGVDDDLAARQARVPVRAADDEFAGGVHPPVRRLGDPARGQDLADIGFDHGAHVVRGHVLVEVLRGQHDRGHLDRLAAFVTQGQLAFRVGAERRLLPGFAHLGQTLQDRVGIEDRGRHQLGRLVDGIPEHDALVARALVLVVGGVHALRDMGGLLVQQVRHLDGGVVELVLLVADVADAVARDGFDPAHVIGQLRLVRQADLAADDDAVGRGEGFTGDARLRFLGDEGIENGIRDAVADLVGVPLRDGLGGEDVAVACHGGKALHWNTGDPTPGSRCGAWAALRP